MKILCFYLPQFHETKENNEWWGKGYTDWVASKNALPLYKGHQQPRIPKDGNYYDLSDESAVTLTWQANLAREHGISGFCIYHYWFAGKKILEKPAEILRKHPEIDIEYTFCWDSSTFRRTWYAHQKEQEVLLEQKFGDEKIWQWHFYDLLPYFQDKRYIKIENKPVFHIYRAASIPCLHEMKACWDELAKLNGFSGIYLISGDILNRRSGDAAIDAYYNYEPVRCFHEYRYKWFGLSAVIRAGIIKRVNRILRTEFFPDKRSARLAYLAIERDNRDYGKKTYLGLFADYDDTPRRQLRGAVYHHNKLSYFAKCLVAQILKSKRKHNEFLYINAWNEWGESAYLEPDEVNGSAYLECIKEVTDKYLR